MMILIPLTLLHFTAFNVFFGAIPGIRVKVIPLLANYVSFVETRFHDDSPWAAIGEVYYQEYGFVALSAVLLCSSRHSDSWETQTARSVDSGSP